LLRQLISQSKSDEKFFAKLAALFNQIAPPQGSYSWFDRLRISLGVGLTVLAIAFFNYLWGDLTQEENMVTAVFGVSAFCIFLFPQSKIFSPIVLLEANLLAACVAFVCVLAIPATSFGIVLAIIGSIGGMYFLGCMHPPAVFLSIFIVLAGETSFDFTLHPVLVDSLLLASASYLNLLIIKRHQK